MSTTVTYKGSTLTTVSNQTRTLKTAGKYMEGDVILTDVSTSSLLPITLILNSDLTVGSGINQSKKINTDTTEEIDASTFWDMISVLDVSETAYIVSVEDNYNQEETVTYDCIISSYSASSGQPYIDFVSIGKNIYIAWYFYNEHFSYYNDEVNINNQNKSVTPSESQQIVTADSGYTGLDTVTVNAISSTYVGSGITQRSSTDLTTSGATVTAPAGYYAEAASKSVATGSIASGSWSFAKNAANDRFNITVTKAVTGGYIASTTTSDTYALVLEDKTITPSTSSQTVNPTSNAYYLNSVTVEAIPSGSATGPTSLSGSSATITTGTNTITLTKTGVTTTPTVSAGYVSSATASTATVALTASVTVNPTPTASGATVTIPAGYYSSQTTKSVSTGSATAPASISGTAASVSTGTNTLTLTKTVSVTPTVSAGYVSSGTAGNSSVSLTANITTQAAKTVTPTESSQTAVAANVYTTGAVTVGAISSTYVGSGIDRCDESDIYETTSGQYLDIIIPAGYYAADATYELVARSESDVTASGATITIPSGYYSSSVSKSVASGVTTAPTSISGTSATVSTGTNTLTLTKTISVTPRVTTAGYVSAGTAGNSSVSLTASVTTKAAATITPTTTNQTIAAGTYLTGAQTIAGDADLVASNIVSGVQIFGVTGNVVLQNYYTGSSAPSSSLGSNGDLYLQS